MEKKYEIKNPTAPASPGQRKMLWAKTQLDWYPNKLVKDINMGDASELIDAIVEYFNGGDKTPKLIRKIETMVQYHTGNNSWTISDLQNTPIRRGKKYSKKLQEILDGDDVPGDDVPSDDVPDVKIDENMTVADLLKAMELAKSAVKLQEENNQLKEVRIELEKNILAMDGKFRDEIKTLQEKIVELENKPVEYTPIKIPDVEYVKPDIFDKVVHILRVCGQVHISGPAGCGKTLMAKMIAQAMEREFYLHNCSGGPALENIIGSTELVKVNGTQVTAFVKALPLEHMEKENTLTVFDEFPALEPESAMGLNGLMEPRTRAISTKAGEVRRHDDNWILTTGNTNGNQSDRKYVGAQIQDGSNSDRRPCVYMDYDPNVERNILNAMELSPMQADTIQERMKYMRDRCAAMQIPFDPSTRRMVNVARLIKSNMPIDDAFEVCFLNDVDERAQKQIKNW